MMDDAAAADADAAAAAAAADDDDDDVGGDDDDDDDDYSCVPRPLLSYQMGQIYSVHCVSKMKYIPTIFFYAIDGAVCY